MAKPDRAWSEAELAMLRAVYPRDGAAAAARALPGRSRAAVYMRANQLGLHVPADIRSQNIKRAVRAYHDQPETKIRKAIEGRRNFDRRMSPEARARSHAPEARVKAGVAISATRRAWCPPAYWETYQALIRTSRLPAAEARRVVEAQAAADNVKRIASMTPFERALERVRAGAPLVNKLQLRKAEPAITLGGVSAGTL